jgi:hypothetical protein
MDSLAAKTAIVVYSRTGHSLRAAERLAKSLNAEVIKLAAPRYGGPVGYMWAGFQSIRQRGSLGPQSFSTLSNYDLVILCGPVWTSYPAIPLRGVLQSIPLPPVVALFLTNGDHSPAAKAFDVGEADLGRSFAAKTSLANAKEGTEEENRIYQTFMADLAAAESSLEIAQSDVLTGQ